MLIGLISDTHGWIHPRLFHFLEACDEIWHAGDIGNIETADALAALKPFKAVHGNIDDATVRRVYKENMHFMAEEMRIWLTHIGGSPGNYDRKVRDELRNNPPDIFICGHSHITRVMYDRKLNLLYLNPGAAGYKGFHKVMTALRFRIDGKQVHDMEVIELGERAHVII